MKRLALIPVVLWPVVLCSVFICACNNSPATVNPCSAQAITKGPYAMRATQSGASLFFETKDSGCVEVAIAPETDSGADSGATEKIVKGTATLTTVQNSYGIDMVPMPDVAGTYYVNQIDFPDLAPGTCYRYRLRSSGTADITGRFCTARPSGQPFHFMAIGDTNPKLNRTVPLFPFILTPPPDFIVHVGDIHYYSSGETWAQWFQMMAPMLRSGVFFPGIGNHESEKEEPTDFADYYDRLFHSPSLTGDSAPRWYRFGWGGIYFHAVDTEAPYDAASPQYTWLINSLKTVSQMPDFRFSVIYMHRNLYTLGDSNPQVDMRQILTPIFESSKVRLVLSGHMHGYERFEVGDITYVTTAGGGGIIGDVDGNVARYPDDVQYRKAASPAYHATLFDVTPKGSTTTVHMRAIGCVQNQCVKPGDYDTLIDEFTRDIP